MLVFILEMFVFIVSADIFRNAIINTDFFFFLCGGKEVQVLAKSRTRAVWTEARDHANLSSTASVALQATLVLLFYIMLNICVCFYKIKSVCIIKTVLFKCF